MDLSALEQKFDSYHGEVKSVAGRLDKMERANTELKSGLEQIETAIARLPAGFSNDRKGTRQTDEQKAFAGFLRGGPESLASDEIKALNRSTDTAGGYLSPDDFVAEMQKNLVLFSPVRQAARVGSTASGSVILPKRATTLTASWVTELGNRSATGPSYGSITIPVHEAACYVDVSNQLLEDSAFNLEAELASDFAEEFGRIEAVAFVNGDGVGKPSGFMADPDITSVNSGSAAVITYAGIVDCFYSLKAPYRSRSVWMLNSTTLASIRKMQDGAGRYIWQPALSEGAPETVLGRPVVEAPDMPNEGAGTYPVIFGDFVSGYRIYDRIQLAVMRDQYTQATNGTVRFHARRRVGGDVVKSEALIKLKCST